MLKSTFIWAGAVMQKPPVNDENKKIKFDGQTDRLRDRRTKRVVVSRDSKRGECHCETQTSPLYKARDEVHQYLL